MNRKKSLKRNWFNSLEQISKTLIMKKVLLYSFISASLLGCMNKEDIDHCKNLDQLDRQMLNTISLIESKYATEKELLRRFGDAQIFWIQYKDRHVRALYPMKKNYYSDTFGDDYNQCKCKEWARLTQVRIDEISTWLEGTNTYKDCPILIQE